MGAVGSSGLQRIDQKLVNTTSIIGLPSLCDRMSYSKTSTLIREINPRVIQEFLARLKLNPVDKITINAIQNVRRLNKTTFSPFFN